METSSTALIAREIVDSVTNSVEVGLLSGLSKAETDKVTTCGDPSREAMRIADSYCLDVKSSGEYEVKIELVASKILLHAKVRASNRKKSFLALPNKIQRLFLTSTDLRADVSFDDKKRLKIGLKPHVFMDIYLVVEEYKRDGFSSTVYFSDDKELKQLGLSKKAKKNKNEFRYKLKKNKEIIERKEQYKKDIRIKNRREVEELYEDLSFLQMEKLAKVRAKNKLKTEVGSYSHAHWSTIPRDHRAAAMREQGFAEEVITEKVNMKSSDEFDFLDYILNYLGVGAKYMRRLSPFSNFIIYIYQLTHCSGPATVGAATWQFFSTIEGVDMELLEPHIRKIIKDSKEWICEMFDEGIVANTEAGEFGIMKEEKKDDRPWSDILEGYGSSLLRMIGGSVFNALRQILLIATGLKFFPQTLATSIYETFGKGERMSILAAIECLFQQFLVLLRFGEGLHKGQSFDKLLESENPTEDFFKRSREHLYYAEKTYQGMPVPGGMDHMSFIAGCKSLVILGEKIVSLAHPYARWKEGLKAEVLRLKSAQFQAEKMMNSVRPAPICFTIVGPPGIGKAKLVTWLAKQHCLAKGRGWTPGMMYNRNFADKFASNYDPASQPIWHYPELGVETAAQAKLKMAEVMSEFLCVADSNPYCPPMADIPSKGTTFVRCDLVIIDTNNELLNLRESVYAPAAQLRRLICIIPLVQPGFRKKGGIGIDEEKSLDADGRYLLDKFTFVVKQYIPVNSQEYKEKFLMDGSEKCDIFALTLLMQKLFKTHISGQERIKTIDDKETATMYYEEAMKRFGEEFDNIDFAANPALDQYGNPPEEVKLPTEAGIFEDEFDDMPVGWMEPQLGTNWYDTVPELQRGTSSVPELVENASTSTYDEDLFNQSDWGSGSDLEDWHGLEDWERYDSKSEEAYFRDLMESDEGSIFYDDEVPPMLPTEAGEFEYDPGLGIHIVPAPASILEDIKNTSLGLNIRNGFEWMRQMGRSCVNMVSGQMMIAAIKSSGRNKWDWKEIAVLVLLFVVMYFTTYLLSGVISLYLALLALLHSQYCAEFFRARVIEEVEFMVWENWNHAKFLLDRTVKKDIFSSSFWRKNAHWLSPLQNRAASAMFLGIATYAIYRMTRSSEVVEVQPVVQAEKAASQQVEVKIYLDGSTVKDGKVKKKCSHKSAYDFQFDENGDTDEEGCPLYDSKHKTEAHSEFVNPAVSKSTINEYEDAMACGLVRKVVPVKENPTMYNVKHEFSTPMPHKGTAVDLARAVQTNTRRVVLNGKLTTYVLGLKEDIFLINAHAIGTVFPMMLMVANVGRVNISIEEGTKFGSYAPVVITEDDVEFINNDQCLVRIRGQQVSDIMCHISIDDYDISECNGFFYGAKRRFKLIRGMSQLVNPDSSALWVDKLWKYKYPQHKEGDCGIPIFLEKNSGVCIGGFHAAGMDEYGYSVVFDRDTIDRALEKLCAKSPLMRLASQGGIFLSKAITEPIAKSAFRHETFHGLKYFGKFEGKVNSHMHSRLKKSLFDECYFYKLGGLMDFDYRSKYDRPVMQATTINGEYISPINIAMRKMAKARAPLDHKLLAKIVDELTERIVEGLKREGITEMHPATLMEAVNGLQTDGTVRRINASTSGGHDFEGPKRGFMPLVDDVMREPNSTVCDEVLRILEAYSKGETSGVIYAGQYKDEPRELEKVKSGKTRVFFMSPLANLIVSRMTLIPIQNAMVNYGHVFCTGIGVNMHGDAKYIELLRDFSPFFLEGDYGNYDQTMPFGIGLAVNTLMLNILKRFGFNMAAMRMARGLLTDLLFPYITFMKDLYQVAGLQVSGKYMTAEDNSLRGLIMLMYAFYSMVTDGKNFFDYVLPWLYGDDVLASVKKEIIHIFNNNTYKKFCEEVFWMPFTSASKSDVMEDYVTIDTCSFLKRRFRYREDIKQWVAPLDMNSIFRSLEWVMPSSNESVEVQMRSTVESALWELSLHLSKEKHDEVRLDLEAKFSDLYTLGEPVSFPKFEDIMGRIFGAAPSA